jgi:glycosyltransferase involved in cell wall biosynthesis
MNARLIVVSLLPGDGPTGVETHFNQIRVAVSARDIATELVMPHGGWSLERKVANVIARTLRHIDVETSILWTRWTSYHCLVRRLRRALSNAAPTATVLYAQDPLSAKAALAIRAELGCRVVAVVHFNVSEAHEMVDKGLCKSGSRLWRALMTTEAQNLPFVDQLIFVSDFMRQQVEQRLPGISTASLVIPNFPGEPKAAPIEETVTGDLIAIGTLEPRKNQQFLLHVIAACKKFGSRYTLTIVGDGPDRNQLETLAQNLAIGEQVRFLGFRRNAATLIPGHKVVVHAALLENLPITLVEALAYGQPVIAAPVGGIPEVFSDGIEGRYWDLADVDGAARIVIATLSDALLLQQMSTAAKATYQGKFERTKLANIWTNCITGRST